MGRHDNVAGGVFVVGGMSFPRGRFVVAIWNLVLHSVWLPLSEAVGVQ